MGVATDPYASHRLLGEALRKKGYSVEFIGEYPATVTFTRPDGAVWRTRAAHLAYPCNSKEVRQISIHKEEAYRFAEKANFSVPFTTIASGEMDEKAFVSLIDIYGSLIVKPADSSLSNGLTLDITTKAQLEGAITKAEEYSPEVLIQQQVVGEEIRFAVVGGKVVAALLRRTARVIGDGNSTIRELIAKENEARKLLVFPYISYPQLDASIVPRELLESERVPAVNEVIELSHSTMIRGGCSVYNILDEVDGSYIERIERLVEQLGAGFIVVDVFCTDYHTPATTNNHWLIEFNSAPVLKLFYGCRDGKHFDIVTQLAEVIDRSLRPNITVDNR